MGVTVDFLSARTSLAILVKLLAPKRHFHPENCCSLNIFPFSHILCKTLEMVVCENSSKSVVSEIVRPAHLAPATMFHSKSLKSHFPPILMLCLNFVSTTSTCLSASGCCQKTGLEICFSSSYVLSDHT